MAIYEKMPDRCACNFLPALLHTLLFTKIVLNILLQLVRDEMYPKSLLISLRRRNQFSNEMKQHSLDSR